MNSFLKDDSVYYQPNKNGLSLSAKGENKILNWLDKIKAKNINMGLIYIELNKQDFDGVNFPKLTVQGKTIQLDADDFSETEDAEKAYDDFFGVQKP